MKSFHYDVRNLNQKISEGPNQQKRFSEQNRNQQYRNIGTLKLVLNLVSGGEPDAILKKLLITDYEAGVFASLETPHIRCLKTICDRFNQATSREDKKVLLSLVANSYTSGFLKKIGFVFGSDLFASAKNYARYVFFFLFV
jgi:hypothetical protein